VGERRGGVENLVIDPRFWAGRRVLLTGHTGFKGAWTALVLRSLGAQVDGFALAPDDARNLFVCGGVEGDLSHRLGDVRDAGALNAAVAAANPEIILHMAAQALVRRSYAEPVATYATNVMGTVNVLDAARQASALKAVVIVTSDKCYENLGQDSGYREGDRLGGRDPYSSSKACAELVVEAYRQSFFGGGDAPCIGSVRAGNVIGGGDWARDRLVPDAMRAFLSGETLRVRNPGAIRPWQHVLDPVIGYLMLAERLASDGAAFSGSWNFGPPAASQVPVEQIVDGLVRLWGDGARWEIEGGEHPHEAASLKLDCAKALAGLDWHPLIELDEALRLTAEWYRAFARGEDMRAVTLAQIDAALDRGAVSAAA
jgi:CDP-glucose 4,6-dehydratase